MAQIKNGKVKIHKVDIDVNAVLSWMEKQGHYVTSVELRDQFNWPLRETARRLMRMLAEQNKIIIKPNPNRKRSYVYGLSSFPELEVEKKETGQTAHIREA